MCKHLRILPMREQWVNMISVQDMGKKSLEKTDELLDNRESIGELNNIMFVKLRNKMK